MFFGVDIGGTKTALCLGDAQGRVLARRQRATQGPGETVAWLLETGRELGAGQKIEAIGISCGSPQDSVRGIIQSPPNLPGWDDVPITDLLSRGLGAPAFLQNDANACALAEWKYGAGQGTENMIFLTFGTGMGAGLILNGRLYGGTCGMAGEVGHLRLTDGGPVGYGKAGSMEGYCSGGGLADLCRLRGAPFANAKDLCEAARRGDARARAVVEESAARLGQGLSLLIDLLNPQAIVIGSVFARAEDLFRPEMERVIRQETLECSRACCRVVAARLGERIGDVAALSVAVQGWEDMHRV